MMSVAPHILVVDDEPDVRELIRTYLAQEGYRVSTLGDGQGLRRELAGQSVDLVILDLGLPGEDGLSLARYLREHSDVGVIIVTGKGQTVDRIVGLEIGADDYLAKPFDLRELLARVRSVLRRTRGPARQDAGKVGTTVRFAGRHMSARSPAAPRARPRPPPASKRCYTRVAGAESVATEARSFGCEALFLARKAPSPAD